MSAALGAYAAMAAAHLSVEAIGSSVLPADTAEDALAQSHAATYRRHGGGPRRPLLSDMRLAARAAVVDDENAQAGSGDRRRALLLSTEEGRAVTRARVADALGAYDTWVAALTTYVWEYYLEELKPVGLVPSVGRTVKLPCLAMPEPFCDDRLAVAAAARLAVAPRFCPARILNALPRVERTPGDVFPHALLQFRVEVASNCARTPCAYCKPWRAARAWCEGAGGERLVPTGGALVVAGLRVCWEPPAFHRIDTRASGVSRLAEPRELVPAPPLMWKLCWEVSDPRLPRGRASAHLFVPGDANNVALADLVHGFAKPTFVSVTLVPYYDDDDDGASGRAAAVAADLYGVPTSVNAELHLDVAL